MLVLKSFPGRVALHIGTSYFHWVESVESIPTSRWGWVSYEAKRWVEGGRQPIQDRILHCERRFFGRVFFEECSLFGQFFTWLSLPDSFETFPLPCEFNMRYFLWKLKDCCSQTERLYDWCNLVSSVLRISIFYVVPSKHLEKSQHPVDGRNPAPVDR